MKKLLLFLMLALCIGAYAQNPKKGLVVKGTVPADYQMEGKVVKLSSTGFLIGGQQLATDTIRNGAYSFTLPEFGDTCMVCVSGGRLWRSFGVAPGDEVMLEGMNAVSAGEANKACSELVDGSWERYNQGRGDIFKKHKDIVEKVHAASTTAEGAELQKTAEYQAYLDDVSAWDKRQADYVRQVVKDNPNSIWPIITLQYHGGIMKLTEAEYALLSDFQKQSAYGKAFQAYLNAQLLGKKAPEFTLADADGKEHTLASLLKGNKYLLIDFWASWCRPCRKGIPVMRDLVAKYKKEGLAIVNISIDEKKAPWLKALGEEKMEWTNLWDTKKVNQLFGVKAIPSVFLLKADGTVVFEKLFGDAIANQLKDIFGY